MSGVIKAYPASTSSPTEGQIVTGTVVGAKVGLDVSIISGGSGGSSTADQGVPNTTANRWPVQLTDGTDLSLVTAAGELNVLATAQPGVDIGDVTINNAAGASAVNVQDGGNSLTIDGSITSILTSVTPGTGAAHLGKMENAGGATGVLFLGEKSPGGGSYSAPTVEDFDGLHTNQMAVHVTNPTLSISGIVPGTTATSLGKAEDAAAASGDTGVVLLAQRHSAFTSTVSAEEDYSTLHVNSLGQLKVSDPGLGGLSDGTLLANVWDASTGQSSRVQDFDPSSSDAGLVVRVVPNLSIDTPVSGSVGVTIVTPGTGATNLGKAEDAAHTTGNVGVMALAVRNDADTALAGTTGDYIPFGTDAVGRLQVNSIGKLAHDAADTAANSPTKVGGQAITNNDALTAVASGHMSNASTDRRSRLIVDSDRWQVASATNATTTDAALIAAPGAGLKLQVYGLFVCLTCPVQTLNVIKDEGVRFRFASGTYHFNVVKTVHHVHTILNAPDSVAFPLEPTMIDLQHGHWDGGDNEALNFSLMGLSGAALGTAYVTAYYRVMPT